jgi:6,7-dimethyl-8-ribityllumazine synthase
MIAIIKSTFNSTVTTGLLEGCIKALEEKNISENQIKIFEVPGAFEIPATTNLLVKKQEYEAIITLGCVIQGETDHYKFICDAVSKGMMQITIQSLIPILFGILTCQTKELAILRSMNDKNNKGYEVGLSAIKQIQMFKSI